MSIIFIYNLIFFFPAMSTSCRITSSSSLSSSLAETGLRTVESALRSGQDSAEGKQKKTTIIIIIIKIIGRAYYTHLYVMYVQHLYKKNIKTRMLISSITEMTIIIITTIQYIIYITKKSLPDFIIFKTVIIILCVLCINIRNTEMETICDQQ